MRDIRDFSSPWKMLRQHFDYDDEAGLNISRYDTWAGTPLNELLPGGVDPLTDWGPPIFEDDFDDFTQTVTSNSGNGPWFTGGISPGHGEGTIATLDNKPSAFTQGPSCIELHTFTGPANGSYQNGITTVTGNRENYAATAKCGFAMQYGLEITRMWIASPLTNYDGSPVTTPYQCWQGYWAYNLPHAPGPWCVPNTNRIEPDYFETYPTNNGSGVLTGERASLRTSLHHHSFQKVMRPGGWGRDHADSANPFQYDLNEGPKSRFYGDPAYPGNFAVWGTDANYRLFDRWTTHGRLITPEWMIILFDPFGGLNLRERCRFRMTTELHQPYFPLFSLTRNTSPAVTSGVNIDSVMKIDWFRAYQNPDWQIKDPLVAHWQRRAPIAAGTGNRIEWTSTIYTGDTPPDGATVVLRPATLGVAGITELKWNGGPFKRVKVHLDDQNPPGSGLPYIFPTTEIDPTPGMLDPDNQFGFKYRAATDDWLLLDCGRPQEVSPVWTGQPFDLPDTTATIDVEEVESIAAIRAGMVSEFPLDHPARAYDNFPTPPFMTPNVSFSVANVAVPGTVVGTVKAVNTPTHAPIYTLSGTNNFVINPTTGVITVANGATLTTTENFVVRAWTNPPSPIIQGAAETRVTTRILIDGPFVPETVISGIKMGLRLWNDDHVTIDVDGTVSEIEDMSGNSTIAQPTVSRRYSYSPTAGPQGGGALINPNMATNRYYTSGSSKYPINKMGGFTFSVYKNPTISNNSVTSFSIVPNDLDITQWHIYQWEWNQPANSVRCWIDGVEVPVDRTLLNDLPNSGWSIYVVRAGVTSGVSERIYAENESFSYVFNNTAFNSALRGACALFYMGEGTMTATMRTKLLRWAAHECWQEDPTVILPDGVDTTYPLLYS